MNKKTVLTTASLLMIAGLMSVVVFAGRLGSDDLESPADSLQKDAQEGVSGISSDEGETEYDAVIYYTLTCPVCREVDAWIEENQVENWLDIDHREVGRNQANSAELANVAQQCGLDPARIGVPFMHSSGECFVGREPVINHLELLLDRSQAEDQEGALVPDGIEAKQIEEVVNGEEIDLEIDLENSVKESP